jgi:plasmid stabilization system protein ParE
MITVRISDDALDDLQDGFWFYEAQEAGVGDYFIACLRADIEGLKRTGGIHRVVYKDYHRLLSRVFPHAIFYAYADDIATVWAVLDCRRDPRWIRERLE